VLLAIRCSFAKRTNTAILLVALFDEFGASELQNISQVRAKGCANALGCRLRIAMGSTGWLVDNLVADSEFVEVASSKL
jgi:hypothetical protein